MFELANHKAVTYNFYGIKNWGKNSPDADLLGELQQGKRPVLVFVPSTEAVLLFAGRCVEVEAAKRPRGGFPERSAKLRELTRDCNDSVLRSYYANGVGILHGRLPSKYRDMFKRLFVAGEIYVLVASADMAGELEPDVEERHHLTFVEGMSYPDPVTGGRIPLGIREVQSVLAHSERMRIMLPYEEVQQEANRIMGYTPLESELQSHMHDLLNAEVAAGKVNSSSEARDWAARSFLHTRMAACRDISGPAGSSEEIVHDAITKLSDDGLLQIDPGYDRRLQSFGRDSAVKSTELGRIAAELDIDCETVATFFRGLAGEKSLPRLLACAKVYFSGVTMVGIHLTEPRS